MSVFDDEERRELVELLRGVSPAVLQVRRPALDARCRRLGSAALPRKPAALFFDVYGTLLVSAAGSDPLSVLSASRGRGTAASAALEEALAAAGISGGAERFAREVAELIRGSNDERRALRPFPEVDIEQLLGERFPALSPRAIRRVATLLEAFLNPCAPMPGAAALLAKLERDGRPAGLVSNAQFYTALLIDARLGPQGGMRRFLPELSFFSYALGVAKPDRAAFDAAAASLAAMGMSARDAVYVGNNFDNDVVPAHRAGFMTVLFAGDERSFRPPAAAAEIEPDSVVASLAEFAAIAGLPR